MLKSIREFFERNLAPGDERAPSRHTIELATAALLIEVVRCDAGITEDERRSVENAVREKFGLSADEAETLIRLAEEEVAQAHDLFQFTSLINRDFTPEQKLRVIELMWRAALADARISAHEHHALRRIAELLHVPHGDYIAAKTRAQAGTA
ncbi:MAG TPA: TerB family tellurite resistance protein [Burkholderiaceae bacterium]|nr:TerB family tellurite resistance protein [Burkholderiaceae bacterium]